MLGSLAGVGNLHPPLFGMYKQLIFQHRPTLLLAGSTKKLPEPWRFRSNLIFYTRMLVTYHMNSFSQNDQC